MAAKVQLLRSVGYFVSNEHYVYMCKLYIHFMRYWFFIRSVGFSFLWSWNKIVSYHVSYVVQQLAMLTLGVENFKVSIARLIRSSCRFQKKYSRSSGTSEDLQELLHDRDRHVDGEIYTDATDILYRKREYFLRGIGIKYFWSGILSV